MFVVCAAATSSTTWKFEDKQHVGRTRHERVGSGPELRLRSQLRPLAFKAEWNLAFKAEWNRRGQFLGLFRITARTTCSDRVNAVI